MQLKNINETPPPLLKLTDAQILDYIKCPQYFMFRWKNKQLSSEQPTFHQLIKLIIDMYLSKLMDGKVMTMKQLKRQWDKLAEEYPLILTEKRILDGIGIINMLDRYCYNNKVIIADINSPYHINLDTNIIVEGKIGPIRYNKNKLELFLIETSQKMPDDFLLNMSLKITAQMYAAEKFLNCKLAGIHIYHIRSGKEYYFNKTNKDYDRLIKNIKNIGFAIRNDIYYPREDFLCSQCKYKLYCGYTT